MDVELIGDEMGKAHGMVATMFLHSRDCTIVCIMLDPKEGQHMIDMT